jgi:hypothetical protein
MTALKTLREARIVGVEFALDTNKAWIIALLRLSKDGWPVWHVKALTAMCIKEPPNFPDDFGKKGSA